MAILAPPARTALLGYGVRAPRPQAPQGIIHALHSQRLRIACATPASSAGGVQPTVVFAGDSTSLLVGNEAFNELETIAGAIQKRLRRQNPTATTLKFIDRGIGGTTWNALAGTPNFAGGITAPSWYISTGQPWVNTYIAPASAGVPDTDAPDLIVICMGTNDLNAQSLADIRNVFNLFANATNFPVTPDVWLCTTTGRTTDLTASTQTQIDGVQLAASASRLTAINGAALLGSTYTKPIGLLDFARQDAIARLGYDPARQVLTTVPTHTGLTGQSVGVLAGALVLPECDGDFECQVTFTGTQAIDMLNNGALRFVLGPAMISGTTEPYLSLVKNSTLISSQIVAAGLLATLTNATLGATTVVIRIAVQQGEAIIFVQGTRIMDNATVTGAFIRGVGRFQPKLYFVSAPPTPATCTVDYFRAGKALRYAPTILETEAWNRDGASKYGGGTVNHPSSYHFADSVRPVLDAQSFCVAA